MVDHRTYVLACDGDLMEGISQEAIALAGHLKLNRLIVLFDDNGISIDGPLSLVRHRSTRWSASRPPAGTPRASTATIRTRSPPRSRKAQTSDRPTLIACKTTIGFGAPTKAGKSQSHGSPLGADEIAGAREELGWTTRRSRFPTTSCAAWRAAGARARPRARPGTSASPRSPPTSAPSSSAACNGELPATALDDAVRALKETLAAEPKDIATRTASEHALESADRRRCPKWSAARPT